MRTAFYPGSFDPPTLGHRDIMRRGLRLFDRLIVGVGVHASKAPLFDEAERLDMLRAELADLGAAGRGEAQPFQGLATEAARRLGAQCILRGLRDATDFAYEFQMAGMNAELAPEIETVFVAASPATAHITSTLVRQIATMGGDASPFVSAGVLLRIRHKFGDGSK
jgi:pantetheine-phosphate adenylyltransferase